MFAVCAYHGLGFGPVLLLEIFSDIHIKLIVFRTNHCHKGKNQGIEKRIEA